MDDSPKVNLIDILVLVLGSRAPASVREKVLEMISKAVSEKVAAEAEELLSNLGSMTSREVTDSLYFMGQRMVGSCPEEEPSRFREPTPGCTCVGCERIKQLAKEGIHVDAYTGERVDSKSFN